MPRFLTSSKGQLLYTANPSWVEAVNILASASNRASRICTGLVDDMECRARFMVTSTTCARSQTCLRKV